MKWLLILLIPLSSVAQDSTKYIVLTRDTSFVMSLPTSKPNKGKWSEYGLFTASILSNSVGDGLNSRQYYAQGHALNALSVGCLLAYPFAHKVNWKSPLTYILVRFALFDLFYNIGAHRDLNYRGGKNFYNQGVGHIPLGALNASKAAALALSVYINLK